MSMLVFFFLIYVVKEVVIAYIFILYCIEK